MPDWAHTVSRRKSATAYLDAGEATAAPSRTLALYADVKRYNLPGGEVLMPLLSLSAALSGAQTGRDVLLAFRQTALPAGSYRARRRGRGAVVSLNMNPGIVGGAEWLSTSERGLDYPIETPGVVSGVTLPVGLNVVLGTSRGGSISPFTPLLDRGALFSCRLSGTSAQDHGARATIAVTPNAGVREVMPRFIPRVGPG